MSDPIKHFVIPDCQVEPGVPTEHLLWAGKYIAEKRPDNIILLCDFNDMPSLSPYEPRGSRQFEGRRYLKDIEAGLRAMERLVNPFAKLRNYHPRMDATLGNHEQRIETAVKLDPRLEGVISLEHLRYKDYGWKVHPFLKPIVRDGVRYAHYFTYGKRQQPCSSARKILSTQHASCVQGHQQGWDIAVDYRGDGSRLTTIIAGSFYQHNPEFLGFQGNHYWRGCVMLHEVKAGEFDPMFVSMRFLKDKFG